MPSYMQSPRGPQLGAVGSRAGEGGRTPSAPAAHIGAQRVRRDNRLIGKNVRITSGVMKSEHTHFSNHIWGTYSIVSQITTVSSRTPPKRLCAWSCTRVLRLSLLIAGAFTSLASHRRRRPRPVQPVALHLPPQPHPAPMEARRLCTAVGRPPMAVRRRCMEVRRPCMKAAVAGHHITVAARRQATTMAAELHALPGTQPCRTLLRASTRRQATVTMKAARALAAGCRRLARPATIQALRLHSRRRHR